MICIDLFIYLKKDFFWWRRHRILREDDSLGGTTANCHMKTQASGFGGENEKFSKQGFSERIEKEKREKKENKRMKEGRVRGPVKPC